MSNKIGIIIFNRLFKGRVIISMRIENNIKNKFNFNKKCSNDDKKMVNLIYGNNNKT